MELHLTSHIKIEPCTISHCTVIVYSEKLPKGKNLLKFYLILYLRDEGSRKYFGFLKLTA